jgi:hypothetical protein
MKLTDYVKKYGTRKTAMKLVSDRIFIHSGITANELSDTHELCSMYDEIEEVLKDYKEDWQNISNILDEIDFDFVNNLIYE